MKNTKENIAILLCAALLMSGCSGSNRPQVVTPAVTAAATNADDDSYGYGYGTFATVQTTQQIIPASTPIGWFAESEDKGDYTVMKVETSKGLENFKLSTFKEQLLAMDTPTKLQTSNRVTVCDESGVQIVYTENADGGISIDFCDVEVLKAAMDDSFCQVLHSKSTFFDMHMGTTTDYLTISEPSMKEVDSDITRSGCYKSVNDGFTVTAYTNGGYTYYFILDVEAKLLKKDSAVTTAIEQISESYVDGYDTSLSDTFTEPEEVIAPVIAEGVSDFTYESGSRGSERDIIRITGLSNKFSTEKAVALNIPETILGNPVKIIDKSAFKGKNNIVEVNLPNNVDTVENDAFNGLTSLKKVTFGDNISSIDKMAFKGCNNLSEVVFNNKECCITIYDEAFMDCVALETITIPAISGGDISTRSLVGKCAFKGCTGLKTVNLKDGTSCIDEEAFAQCENIEELILPDSIELIGNSAFEGCTSLKKVSMNNERMNLCPKAFCGCTSLKDIDFGNTIFSGLGAEVFANCTSIETIVLPSLWDGESQYSRYGNGIFMGCTALKTVVLPDKQRYSIPEKAFFGCSSLEKIVLPANVYAIRASAFEGCSSLSDVQFPEFSYLSQDTNIGQQAFKDCPALKNIAITGEGTIGRNAFENCTGLTDLNINGIAWIVLLEAFKGCTSLETVEIQLTSICQIDQSVFADCTSLTKVILPERTTLISTDSFARCINLRSITIPDSIGNYNWLGAFTDCTNITVTYKGEKYSYEDLKSLKANMGN